MKIAFLYGGQGSQKPGMGLDFYENSQAAKEFYDSIDIEKNVKELSFFSDEKTLKETENTQVALVAFQIMVTKLLKEKGISPDATAGLSIGEYGALYSSGVLRAEDALKIAEFRGEAMKKSSENIDTLMYAIVGSSEDIVSEVVTKHSDEKNFASISNLNCPGQIVISGERSAVLASVESLKEMGSKAIELKVSGPFHTEYMKDAAKELENFFKTVDFKVETVDMYYNLTGKQRSDEDVKEMMIKQVMRTVRFEDALKNMVKDGVDLFVEIGFNNVLKGFMRKVDRKIKVSTISTYDEYLKFVEEIQGE
ncbi:ACP S-malonyltransferase [Anaerosphaera multitolerans]|uniref:Malonyl CoA-acyl carrier protein transacylase n=1 Tax=Anaerosphaera multitolerans TaxID=2487351 RepID=A0A437S728_9FIRM|nr:ACP S-malonyltransferase [Anaerosphaera multitolerans]RVU54833.1 ACP S-malonyltransferase [Anaerosphaera multitolerans]